MLHPLNKYFDKIYCINLINRKDRKIKIKKRFIKLGINVEFFDAIPFGFAEHLIDKFNIVKPNEFGCSISHYTIITSAKHYGYSRILILEDDTVFLKNFNNIIQSYIDIIPKKWDMIYFTSNTWKWTPEHKWIVKNKLFTMHEGRSTAAYAINESFYNEVIRGLNKEFGIIDDFYMGLMEDTTNKIYSFYPNLTAQDWSYSDITDETTNYFHPGIVTYGGKTDIDYA